MQLSYVFYIHEINFLISHGNQTIVLGVIYIIIRLSDFQFPLFKYFHILVCVNNQLSYSIDHIKMEFSNEDCKQKISNKLPENTSI